jgi:hypothetical protein
MMRCGNLRQHDPREPQPWHHQGRGIRLKHLGCLVCRISTMPTSTPKWLLFAVASGACAALNGVFAKL